MGMSSSQGKFNLEVEIYLIYLYNDSNWKSVSGWTAQEQYNKKGRAEKQGREMIKGGSPRGGRQETACLNGIGKRELKGHVQCDCSRARPYSCCVWRKRRRDWSIRSVSTCLPSLELNESVINSCSPFDNEVFLVLKSRSQWFSLTCAVSAGSYCAQTWHSWKNQ